MEEICVNDYVRTIYGEIFKVFRTTKQKEKYILVNEEVDRNEDRACNDNCLNISEIVKHSPNIIDLIEEGDYVNGEKVLHIDKCLYEGEKVIITELNHSIFDNMIDDIVTKEQFEQMKYNVGDD